MYSLYDVPIPSFEEDEDHTKVIRPSEPEERVEEDNGVLHVDLEWKRCPRVDPARVQQGSRRPPLFHRCRRHRIRVGAQESTYRNILLFHLLQLIKCLKASFQSKMIQSRPTSYMSLQEYGYQRDCNPSAHRRARSRVERPGK